MENTKTFPIREQIAKLVDEYAMIALAPQPFLPGLSVIPPSGKVIGAEELKNMVEASLDGWLTTGRFNAEFEKKLAAFTGSQGGHWPKRWNKSMLGKKAYLQRNDMRDVTLRQIAAFNQTPQTQPDGA